MLGKAYSNIFNIRETVHNLFNIRETVHNLFNIGESTYFQHWGKHTLKFIKTEESTH